MTSRLIAALKAAWRSVLRVQRIGRPLLTQAGQMATAAKARKVASFWDENSGRHCEPFAHWESPAPIRDALIKLVTGDISILPPGWFMRHHGPFGHVAELGCGDGILVHFLLVGDPGLTVDAYDISTASLARAAERIKAHCGTNERCRFMPIDLNRESLPEAAYDAVLTTGTMHHVENLDFCFGNLARSLRPGGYLWLNDYIGPNRFQWSDTQMRLADELLALVPKSWRRRDKVARCDAPALGAMDPSEAVASQHIEAALAAHFEIVQKWPRGGTLLAPIFGSGCLDAAMADSPEGLATLAAMFEAEQDLIRDGALPSDSYVYIAKPRPSACTLVREAFERHAGSVPEAGILGIRGSLDPWLRLNEFTAFESVRARDWVAQFPPAALRHRTSGAGNDQHFAADGAAILRALAAASRKPLSEYRDLLDFGVGAGRLARMFKGFQGRYAGVDIDAGVVDWIAGNLPWVQAVKSEPGRMLPFADADFDAVVGISVFTHMNERDQFFYLDELRRVTRAGAMLFLTVSGARVLERAETEPDIAGMLALPEGGLATARAAFDAGPGFCFLLQYGHLTSKDYEYGVTFISEAYIARNWSRYFEVEDIVPGAIHDFQDIVVLRRRDDTATPGPGC
ncbi:MAG: methyltransferase domain-containing protein [Methylocella sp.]